MTVAPELGGKRIFSKSGGGRVSLKGAINIQLQKISLFDDELLIARLWSDPKLCSKRCLGTDLMLRDLAEVAVHIGAVVSPSVAIPLAGHVGSEESFF
jgi:hypothetical protein